MPSGKNGKYTSPRFLIAVTTICLALALLPIRQASGANLRSLSPELLADGWISLFDGETLFGWQPTSGADWKVEDGAITVSHGKEGFLMTDVQFANYELHAEFRTPESTNSGIFLRTPLAPTDPARDCYELNIAPKDNPFPTGSLVKRKKWTGNTLAANLASAPQMIGSASKPDKNGKPKSDKQDASPTPTQQSSSESTASHSVAVGPSDNDGWHSFDIRLSDGDVDVCMNGQRLYTYKDDAGLRRGHIALQFREGPVSFRNIRLRPIGLKSMLNGKDLSGWNTDKAEAAKFELEPDDPRGRESFATAPSSFRGPPRNPAGPLGGPRVDQAPVAKDSRPLSARPLSVLHVTGGRGQLESNDLYGDFMLQLQCRVEGDGLNSGVFFRSIPHDFQNGYECQINNRVKDNDPTKPSDFGTGAIYRRIAARRVVSKDHEWFDLTLAATGPDIAVWVDGYQVTGWTDKRPPDDNPRSGLRTAPGSIILQAHDPTTNFRFKNLRIAELPVSRDAPAKAEKENTNKR
jgi:hypothetical protein